MSFAKKLLLTLILFSSFLMASQSATCQSNYPKKIVYEGDTVVCVSKYQVRQINKQMAQIKGLESEIWALKDIVQAYKDANLLQTERLLDKDKKELSYQELVDLNNCKIEILQDQKKDMVKQLKKAKVHRTGFGIIAGLAVVFSIFK